MSSDAPEIQMTGLSQRELEETLREASATPLREENAHLVAAYGGWGVWFSAY